MKSRLDKTRHDSDSEIAKNVKTSKTSHYSKKICKIFSADYPEVIREYGLER